VWHNHHVVQLSQAWRHGRLILKHVKTWGWLRHRGVCVVCCGVLWCVVVWCVGGQQQPVCQGFMTGSSSNTSTPGGGGQWRLVCVGMCCGVCGEGGGALPKAVAKGGDGAVGMQEQKGVLLPCWLLCPSLSPALTARRAVHHHPPALKLGCAFMCSTRAASSMQGPLAALPSPALSRPPPPEKVPTTRHPPALKLGCAFMCSTRAASSMQGPLAALTSTASSFMSARRCLLIRWRVLSSRLQCRLTTCWVRVCVGGCFLWWRG
jgi:hypothetical protein